MGLMHLVLWAALAASSTSTSASPAATQFEHLKTLVGTWQGTTANGRVLDVSYRLTANGTVLVETWTLGPNRESLTLYHLDGARLTATHYCPLGNQPRLQATPTSTRDAMTFEFVSATNLPDTAAAHQHRFDLRFDADGAITRSETYVENGKGESEAIRYVRK